MFVARDKDNDLRVYTKKPIRWKEYNIWYVPGDNDGYSQDYELKIDQSLYPELTWEDEPIEVELTQKNILYGAMRGDKFVTRNGTIVECMTPYNTDNPYMKFRCEGSDWIWSFYKRLNQCNEAYLPKEFECYEDTNIIRRI